MVGGWTAQGLFLLVVGPQSGVTLRAVYNRDGLRLFPSRERRRLQDGLGRVWGWIFRYGILSTGFYHVRWL